MPVSQFEEVKFIYHAKEQKALSRETIVEALASAAIKGFSVQVESIYGHTLFAGQLKDEPQSILPKDQYLLVEKADPEPSEDGITVAEWTFVPIELVHIVKGFETGVTT